jgi:hypothetical protein
MALTPAQRRQVDAAITVGSNLYERTITGSVDAPAPLEFSLPDSRYRYLLFCLSVAVTAALAYDERKDIQPDVLCRGCLDFATWTATDNVQEYFGSRACPPGAADSATAYFTEFLKHWSTWPALEKAGRLQETWEMIGFMIHTTESSAPASAADQARLAKLALEIDCRLPTMRRAFVELASR